MMIIKDKNKDTNVETFFNADKIKLNPNEFVKYLSYMIKICKKKLIHINKKYYLWLYIISRP